MTTLRAAAQQALLVLESGLLVSHSSQVVTALRAALAQQYEPVLDQTAYKAGLSDAMEQIYAEIDCVEMQYSDDPTRLNAARNALINAKQLIMDTLGMVETVQEPVAWMYTGIKQDGTEHGPHLVWKPKYMDAMSASKGAKATPVYTTPPQRKPLTDEEIVDAVRESDFDWQAGWTLDEHEPNRFTTLVRAIERAHGIKEKQ